MNAQLTSSSWNQRRLWSAMFIAGLSALTMAGEAAADTYNFWLKSAASQPYGGATKCAAGAFTYTKTGVTTEVGDTVSDLSMNISQDCIQIGSPAIALPMSGALNVVVRNINLNGEFQGANVDGLAGTLTSGTFTKGCQETSQPRPRPGTQLAQWSVTFNSAAGVGGAPGNRTFTLVERVGTCTVGTPNFNNQTPLILVNGGPYHLYNTIVRPVPEPETLWLMLGGLGALTLLRRRRQLI